MVPYVYGFLIPQVNASGQFCGVAEMIGRVDFNKSMDFWQQDKWTGYFPVKWHIIKDVPNPQLRHIILENNENKPVTNSRDTQEVWHISTLFSFLYFDWWGLYYLICIPSNRFLRDLLYRLNFRRELRC